MTKTREQLEREGVLLLGPIVPEWFKAIADGCSVPRGIRWIMRAEQGRAACYIHDWRYYCAGIANEKGSGERAANRIMADYELKQNRAASMRSRAVGWIYGALYFRGVRAGGAYAMRDRIELMERIPPNRADAILLLSHIQDYYPARDIDRSHSIINEMKMKISESVKNEE